MKTKEIKNKIVEKTNELNDYIFLVLNVNTDLNTDLKKAKQDLYNALLKLDKIKSITTDEKILEIIDGEVI